LKEQLTGVKVFKIGDESLFQKPGFLEKPGFSSPQKCGRSPASPRSRASGTDSEDEKKPILVVG